MFQPWGYAHRLKRCPAVFHEATQTSLLLKLEQNLRFGASLTTIQAPRIQAKAVQQLGSEGLGFGGQNRPVHPLSLQLLQPLHQAFTAELLNSLGLHPWRLDGREAGAKPQVLLQLQQQRRLCGFVEDRRATLEAVRSTPGLEQLPCFLVSWGYLRPQDQSGLPPGIALLHPDRFRAPLAQWP